MSAHAQAVGVVGIVVDGAVRDVDVLRKNALPVYACATNPNGPTRSQSGQIGYPVSVGGVTVAPGDLVVGDDDGVVVVPKCQVATVLDSARRKVNAELQRMEDIKAGKLLYDWLEADLLRVGDLQEGQTLQGLMDAFRRNRQ